MSFYPLIALSVIVAASTGMFVWNVRRSTVQHASLELQRWAVAHDLAVDAVVPEVVGGLFPGCEIAQSIGNPGRVFLQGVEPGGDPWRMLMVRIDAEWPSSALRSIRVKHSIIDQIAGLRPYPSLPGAERFTTCGTNIRGAKILANSAIRTLLPPDLSVLLHGSWIMIDFSARPFDPLEFSRLLPLAEQLIGHLPSQSGTVLN